MGGLAIIVGGMVAIIPPLLLLADAVWTRARVLGALGFILSGAALIVAGVLAGA